ncbi:MAG: enoyl-CoA hydratase/isomerase family protein [Chloroflexi bacterium]|nr:enoyl-CoA hydratase/isomerase family protein [Chloroflexota bacterium]
MEENPILIDVSDGVATFTINRPHAMNAMSTRVTSTLPQILGDLAQDDAVRVVVIRGAGDKAFCAGHDLKELVHVKLGREGDVGNTARCIETIGTFPKPTIAAVKGYVRGGGNWLAASCDIVVAAEDATFALPQLNFGDFEALPGVPIMRRIGRSKLMDMLLTTDVIDAKEAKAIGLVDRLLPVEGFWEAVGELARKIASRDPQAVKAGKEALWLLVDADYARQVEMMKQARLAYEMAREPKDASQQVEHHIAAVRGSGSRR